MSCWLSLFAAAQARLQTETGPPTGPLDWFRGFREIEARLVEWSARTGCDARQHRGDQPREWRTDPDQWAAFLHTVVDGREQDDMQAALRS